MEVMHTEVTVVVMVTRPTTANPQYFYLRRREVGGREVQGREDSWDTCRRVMTWFERFLANVDCGLHKKLVKKYNWEGSSDGLVLRFSAQFYKKYTKLSITEVNL